MMYETLQATGGEARQLGSGVEERTVFVQTSDDKQACIRNGSNSRPWTGTFLDNMGSGRGMVRGSPGGSRLRHGDGAHDGNRQRPKSDPRWRPGPNANLARWRVAAERPGSAVVTFRLMLTPWKCNQCGVCWASVAPHGPVAFLDEYEY